MEMGNYQWKNLLSLDTFVLWKFLSWHCFSSKELLKKICQRQKQIWYIKKNFSTLRWESKGHRILKGWIIASRVGMQRTVNACCCSTPSFTDTRQEPSQGIMAWRQPQWTGIKIVLQNPSPKWFCQVGG